MTMLIKWETKRKVTCNGRSNGASGVRTPLGSKFFHFDAFFVKIIGHPPLSGKSMIGHWYVLYCVATRAQPCDPVKPGSTFPHSIQRLIQDFPGGGGGAPTNDFAKFSRKLHEKESIWVPGGAPLSPPLNPPLLSPVYGNQSNR